MKSMCRRRPTGAALAIVAAVAHQASAFVAPSASTSTLPSASRLHASVEDATTTATDGNAVSIEEKAAETAISENPRKSGLALMLDDGELYAYPDGGDGADQLLMAEAAAVATSFSDDDDENHNERRRTMVDIPSEIMYHGNLVVHTPLRRKPRERGRRRLLLRRLLSRIRAS